MTEAVAGFVGVTPHMIRDIWTTEYLEKFPGDIAGAARRLGNTEAMILNHYAHIIKRDVDARADDFLQSTFTAENRLFRSVFTARIHAASRRNPH